MEHKGRTKEVNVAGFDNRFGGGNEGLRTAAADLNTKRLLARMPERRKLDQDVRSKWRTRELPTHLRTKLHSLLLPTKNSCANPISLQL